MANGEYCTDTFWACRHCGELVGGSKFLDERNGACKYCGATMIDTHDTGTGEHSLTLEQLREKFVYNHPLFSKEAFVAREKKKNEDEQRREINYERKMRGLCPIENQPKCPVCGVVGEGRKKLRKINAVNKIGSVALFGVFAVGHVSKAWHCDNCGHEF